DLLQRPVSHRARHARHLVRRGARLRGRLADVDQHRAGDLRVEPRGERRRRPQLRSNPRAEVPLLMRRAAFAIAALVLATSCPPEKSEAQMAKEQFDGLYLAGSAAFLKGEFAEAHQKFEEAKKLEPADPRLPAA